MCPKINNILKSLRIIECGESIQEPRDVFLYQFNNNDPINRIYAKPYMTQISDWMETFNIKEPKRYFDDGGGGIFGASAMEHDISFDYGRSQRRPRLWSRIKSEPQLFGPNIVFSIDTNNSTFVQESVNLYRITASALRGAGTVENIVVDLLNGSHYLSDHICFHGALSRDQEQVRNVLGDYDLLIILGADVLRMSVWSEIDPMPKNLPIFQIGLLDWEMGKNYPTERAIYGHLNETLNSLIPILVNTFSLFEVIITTGRCLAEMVCPVSYT